MFELIYKDSYYVECVFKYEDYEVFMLVLLGCVILLDIFYVIFLIFKG